MSANPTKFYNSKFFKQGLPFLLICVGGSFGLKGFTSIRYEYSTKSKVTLEQLEQEGIRTKPKEESTIDAQYKKMQDMDIDNWDNIRGPRPWEEGSIERNKEKNKK